jgi:hypothetical protein
MEVIVFWIKPVFWQFCGGKKCMDKSKRDPESKN